MKEVTFGQFYSLCKKKSLDDEGFFRLFGRYIEEPRQLWKRITQGQYEKVVIPYASLLDWYDKEAGLVSPTYRALERASNSSRRAKARERGYAGRASVTPLKGRKQGKCRWGCSRMTPNVSRICDDCWASIPPDPAA